MASLDLLKELDAKLAQRRELTDLFEDYYAGRHRLAYATEKYRDAFGSLFGAWADNWCGVIADTPVERLDVDGFTTEEGDGSADDVFKTWKSGGMELHSKIAMLGAVKTGHSYVLVDTTQDKPTFHVWPSSMAIVKRDPRTREVVAGMVTWKEADGAVWSILFEPHATTTFKSSKPDRNDEAATREMQSTVTRRLDDSTSREWGVYDEADNVNGGAIPLVEITNRPNELGIGRSDLADVLALQDAINKLTNDMIIASEFQAFRQRVLTGVEIPKDENGNPIAQAQVEAAMSRLWAFEDADAKVYDLPPADLSNYVSGIKELLNHLAAQTRTPPHYLIGQMVNVSGEALAAAESGLVSRVKSKMMSFEISFREIIRLATGKQNVEVVWANPERVALAAAADAAGKLALPALGLDREWIWSRVLGMSPSEVSKFKKSPAAAITQIDGTATTSTDAPPAPPAA